MLLTSRHGAVSPPLRPVISFTTDFGQSDPYVGTVKAVILSVCRDAAIVDVTHAVSPQSVLQAVFVTRQSWPYFPAGTTHLVVVDPGVGTERRAIAVRTPRGYAVGPDNGVLSAALDDITRAAAAPSGYGDSEARFQGAFIPVPDRCEVREIVAERVVLPRRSATFHGRDVFGPAAAHLAAGFPFKRIGPLLDGLWVLPPIGASRDNGSVHGVVVHVDRFGNLVTSIRADDLPAWAWAVRTGGRTAPLVRTYGESHGEPLVALVGSAGYLEIAVPNGSAAQELAATLGTVVEVLLR